MYMYCTCTYRASGRPRRANITFNARDSLSSWSPSGSGNTLITLIDVYVYKLKRTKITHNYMYMYMCACMYAN